MRVIRNLLLAGLLVPVSVSANEIVDAINNGLKHYQAGELSQATSQLDYAATLIRQQKAEEVKKAFPDAPNGWTSEDASADVAASAMFGGGISASRSYSKGDNYIQMELMMDSPMLQAFSGMLSNPSMIAMSGGKITKVQGVNAVIRSDGGESTEIQFITPGNAMVTVRGPSSEQATMMQLANQLDFKKL